MKHRGFAVRLPNRMDVPDRNNGRSLYVRSSLGWSLTLTQRL